MGLWHFLGLDNVAGFAYAFWSGSGSVIIPPILNVAGLGTIYWWHHQCHEPGCYLLGKYNEDGTPYVYCRVHHSSVPSEPLRRLV